MHAGSTSSAVRVSRHTPTTLWLLLLLAVALALLNPLACLIHCLPRPQALATGYAAICHTPLSPASQVPSTGAELTRGQSQTPQAAFAFVAPLLVVLLLRMRRAVPFSFEPAAASQIYLRPLSPPPR